LYAARALRKAPVEVTLFDRRNHHVFQPLLYQVATATLNPSDIASPIRSVLRRQKNARVLLGEATAVDVEAKKVILSDGEIGYDYLIVATGATHSYFGKGEWERFAPGLKTIDDALEIRRRVLYAFEAAEKEADRETRKAWLTFVVVGGGPTGVELAGALVEVAHHTLARDFRNIDPTHARVVLVEGLEFVLNSYPVALREKARKQLCRMGVEVHTEQMVTGIDDGGVTLGQERIPAKTVLWGAGVSASPLGRTLGAPLDRAGRVRVTPNLTLPGHDEVFVVGDLASLEIDGKPVPGVAGAAIQGGRYAAKSIGQQLLGRPYQPFRYVNKGELATIGRKAAIADFGRVRLSGLLAWWAWLFIHILLLIGFRNRLVVLIEWAWAYLAYHRGARLITGDPGAAHAKVRRAPGAEIQPPANPLT
jgi:NADH dehydrogenase